MRVPNQIEKRLRKLRKLVRQALNSVMRRRALISAHSSGAKELPSAT
jgi:hypothetical protein